ncbi:arylsulfatase [Lentisphaera profundi]|uniref:Arylsulfatase n=1 Tax=Lentisphaera profundi TaxID=1658616 RepID=A0ABY7VTD1_9BACT|nr:arylsulfatase [Lentisphaera profundi]WDE95398.1 arylsulfatase [Lentisphaera profundi]
MKFIFLSFFIFLNLFSAEKPNIVFILVDDMGYSDLGCYGSEISTPNIDSLAQNGLRYTQMYNTSKCFPSRACLLTGVYAQQSGMDKKHAAMLNAVTLGEVLKTAGYRTLAAGKHHGTENLYERGFDHYYGLRDGASNMWNPGKQRSGEATPGNKGRTRYWCDDEKTIPNYTPEDRNFHVTDAFTHKALEWLDEKELDSQPFFLYLSYTAPHYPLHAWPEDIAKQKGKYDRGYEVIQNERYNRMVEMGIIDPHKSPLAKWPGKNWTQNKGIELEKEKRRMEIYAAMIEQLDHNVGKVISKLKALGKYKNTLIMFASDNGACSEGSGAKTQSTKLEDFGTVASYETVGKSWASVQNTPLRNWKNYSHEGGIRTPFIVHWPGKISSPGTFNREPVHFIDIMSTYVELTAATYPTDVTPMQGTSLLPTFKGKEIKRSKSLFWQWQRGGAIRDKNWKAVFWNKNWELFDMSKDQNEAHDLASQYPEKLQAMKKSYHAWYKEAKQK